MVRLNDRCPVKATPLLMLFQNQRPPEKIVVGKPTQKGFQTAVEGHANTYQYHGLIFLKPQDDISKDLGTSITALPEVGVCKGSRIICLLV